MITPFIKQNKFNVGDIVINTEPIINDYCHIHIGHKFTILLYDEKYATYTLYDEDSGIKISVRVNVLSLVTDIKTAKKYYEDDKNKKEAIKFICKHCPNKSEEIDHRDVYDACSLDKKSYYPSCKPQLECVKYIEYDKIKNNKFIYDYFRNLKVKKLLT